MKISDITEEGIKVILKYYDEELIGTVYECWGVINNYKFVEDVTHCGCEECDGHWRPDRFFSRDNARRKIRNNRIRPHTFVDQWEKKRNGCNNKASKASV